MTTKLFVGSLPYSVDDQQLAEIFAEAGTVVSARVIRYHDNDQSGNAGRSKGFGFVEMSNEDESKKAIDTVNGKEVEGRTIRVSEARPMTPRD